MGLSAMRQEGEAVKVASMTEEEVTRALSYAGLILVAYELVKTLIISPIKAFYSNTTFGTRMPFKSYEDDVLSRHKNEFEACLLYLRDFMGAIDAEDLLAIQMLRRHRNDLAHDLPNRLHDLEVDSYMPLLETADKALFKLSNYRTRMEIGSDPEFRDRGIDWNTVMGSEYAIFKEVVTKLRIWEGKSSDA